MAGIDRRIGSVLAADQRYYHFVVLQELQRLSLSDYWALVGNVAESDAGVFVEGLYPIEHRKLRLPTSFARGAVVAALSESGTGGAPFLYDLFASRVKLQRETYLILGFPFARLGETLLDKLMDESDLLNYGRFVRTDVSKLIHTMEHVRSDEYAGLETKIVGIQVVVKNDTSLTAIRLGGQNPLSADIYSSFLSDRIKDGSFVPNRCVLANRREADVNDGVFVEGRLRSLQSRTHVDLHGNFRFYAQLGCGNLRMLPFLIDRLLLLDCLKSGKVNPLKHQQSEEE